jgi:hypothetical protein
MQFNTISLPICNAPFQVTRLKARGKPIGYSQGFRADLNELIVLVDLISEGRQFHSLGAVNEKLLSPYTKSHE